MLIENIGGIFYLEHGYFRLRWDEESTWLITVETRAQAVNIRGLCGNYDGDALSKKLFYIVYPRLWRLTYVYCSPYIPDNDRTQSRHSQYNQTWHRRTDNINKYINKSMWWKLNSIHFKLLILFDRWSWEEEYTADVKYRRVWQLVGGRIDNRGEQTILAKSLQSVTLGLLLQNSISLIHWYDGYHSF